MFHRIYRPNHSLEGIPGFESYRDQINLGRVDEILHLEDIFRTVWSEKRRMLDKFARLCHFDHISLIQAPIKLVQNAPESQQADL